MSLNRYMEAIFCKYKAVLFDFDGTLCDSWVLVKKTYQDVLLQIQPTASTDHIEAIRSCNNHVLAHQQLFKVEQVDDSYSEQLTNTYKDYLKKEITPLFPNVESVLQLLNQQHIPWGIVTTKRRSFVEMIIDKHSILKTNSNLICAEDVTKGKPSPEGLLKACKQLNVTMSETVYIGDLPADIQAANACDMEAIWVNYGYHEHPNPDLGQKCRVATSMQDVQAILFTD